MFWERASVEKRDWWYGLDGTITAITRIPASIVRGIMWEQGFIVGFLIIPSC